MSSLQQHITVMLNLVAQLRELDQLRERIRKAQLSGRKSRRISRRRLGHADCLSHKICPSGVAWKKSTRTEFFGD
jgi:hypothetical protein